MLTEIEFYDRFSSYEKEKLFDIIVNKDNFQQKAVFAAKRIIINKNLSNELADFVSSHEVKKSDEESLELDTIEQNAEYYSKAVRFKKENNYINIRTPEIIRFEAALQEASIDFFTEDKNVDAFISHFPTHTYYFLTENLESVDEIMKQYQMTDPHLDPKPFMKFELKTIAIVLTALVSLALIIGIISR
ncbi:MAG: hypothetical protein OCD76_25860 [Reichenbachiella sp.]